jgi:tartrate-resistant acid phosphatase type 5
MDYSRRDFVRTLFVASQATLLGRFFTENASAVEIVPGGYNFVIIGDWGRMGRSDQAQVARQMALTSAKIKSKFVISVGDNFYEKGVSSVDDIQFQKSFENVYAAPSLQVPWNVILGNHDYVGNPDAQSEYAKTHPRWGMPARYYPQSHVIDTATQADFFYINTSPMIQEYRKSPPMLQNIVTQDVPAQLRWLDQSLVASTAPWKIVFGHHPIYSGGLHGDQPELIAQVLPLLERYKVQAYFCGHDHDLQHLKAGNVNLFVSGGGSEHRPNKSTPETQFGRSASGFAAVSLTGNAMQVQLIDNDGKLLYGASVARKI